MDKFYYQNKNSQLTSIRSEMIIRARKINLEIYDQYDSVPQTINDLIIDSFIFNKNTSIVSQFKDNILYNLNEEYLKRHYTTDEYIERHPKIISYYKNYLMFFCKPFFRNFNVNILIQYNSDKRAELYYKENFGGNSNNTENTNEISLILNESLKNIFTKSVKNSILNHTLTKTQIRQSSNMSSILITEKYNKEQILKEISLGKSFIIKNEENFFKEILDSLENNKTKQFRGNAKIQNHHESQTKSKPLFKNASNQISTKETTHQSCKKLKEKSTLSSINSNFINSLQKSIKSPSPHSFKLTNNINFINNLTKKNSDKVTGLNTNKNEMIKLIQQEEAKKENIMKTTLMNYLERINNQRSKSNKTNIKGSNIFSSQLILNYENQNSNTFKNRKAVISKEKKDSQEKKAQLSGVINENLHFSYNKSSRNILSKNGSAVYSTERENQYSCLKSKYKSKKFEKYSVNNIFSSKCNLNTEKFCKLLENEGQKFINLIELKKGSAKLKISQNQPNSHHEKIENNFRTTRCNSKSIHKKSTKLSKISSYMEIKVIK